MLQGDLQAGVGLVERAPDHAIRGGGDPRRRVQVLGVAQEDPPQPARLGLADAAHPLRWLGPADDEQSRPGGWTHTGTEISPISGLTLDAASSSSSVRAW